MKLGIDLDGVVYNFGQAWEDYFRNLIADVRQMPLGHPEWLVEVACELPQIVPPRGAHWDFYDVYGLDWPQFEYISELGVEEDRIFRHGEMMPNAAEVMMLLQNHGHSIHIITHRFFGEKSVSHTEAWLQDRNVPFDTLTFAKDKSIVGVDLLLDDLDKNLLSMGDDTIKVLMANTWNDHVEHPEIFEVNSWYAFYAFVCDHERAELAWSFAQSQEAAAHG